MAIFISRPCIKHDHRSSHHEIYKLKKLAVRHKNHKKSAHETLTALRNNANSFNAPNLTRFLTHVAVDLHGSGRNEEIGRGARERFGQRNWKLTESLEEGVDQFGDDRSHELGQSVQPFLSDRSALRCWLGELQADDFDGGGDVDSVQFWHEITTQQSNVGSSQQFPTAVLTSWTENFQSAVAAVEKASFLRLKVDGFRFLTAAVDDFASVIASVWTEPGSSRGVDSKFVVQIFEKLAQTLDGFRWLPKTASTTNN